MILSFQGAPHESHAFYGRQPFANVRKQDISSGSKTEREKQEQPKEKGSIKSARDGQPLGRIDVCVLK
jgi:hypothetical protein